MRISRGWRGRWDDRLLQPLFGDRLLRGPSGDNVAARSLNVVSKRRRLAKPSDPVEIARRRAAELDIARNPARWGVDPTAMALAANTDVQTTNDFRGRIARASRKDVFDLFHERAGLSRAALDAVRRLQADIAILHRAFAGGGEITPRVDRSRDPQGFSERRIAAGSRIEAVLERTGRASAQLLRGLCEADVVLGRAQPWRAVVADLTGETLPDAQGAALRAACENLAGAYASVDRGAAFARLAARASSQEAIAARGSSPP
jgi:hypothetical protein